MENEYIKLEDRGDDTLLKFVMQGREDAFHVLMDRYMELVSRTTFRILCDRADSEAVTTSVFIYLWRNVLTYDDRFSLQEWLLRRACVSSRIRITRRRTLSVFGIKNDVFVQAAPKVDDQDDYVTKQAWEVFCRASVHMTPLQNMAYTLGILERLPLWQVSKIVGLSKFRVNLAMKRASEKVMDELRQFGRLGDYDRYVNFLRMVEESRMNRKKIENNIMELL